MLEDSCIGQLDALGRRAMAGRARRNGLYRPTVCLPLEMADETDAFAHREVFALDDPRMAGRAAQLLPLPQLGEVWRMVEAVLVLDRHRPLEQARLVAPFQQARDILNLSVRLGRFGTGEGLYQFGNCRELASNVVPEPRGKMALGTRDRVMG